MRELWRRWQVRRQRRTMAATPPATWPAGSATGVYRTPGNPAGHNQRGSAYRLIRPWQVRSHRFPTVPRRGGGRGLDPGEVAAFLDRVAHDLGIVYAELERTWEQNDRIKDALRRWQVRPGNAHSARRPPGRRAPVTGSTPVAGSGGGPALTVRAATAVDVEPLAELLAQSCVLDPVVSWLISDHALRYLTMHQFFTAELEFGLRHGIVDVVGHCDGVAIWYPHPADRLLGAEHQRRRLRACGDRHGPYAHYTFTAGRLEPSGRHHHLAFLAAPPWLRRQGIGSALLAAHHARLDRTGMPAVVEASSQRQRAFHERHGYRVVQVAHLPAGGPPLWAMRRSGDPVDQPPLAAALRVG